MVEAPHHGVDDLIRRGFSEKDALAAFDDYVSALIAGVLSDFVHKDKVQSAKLALLKTLREARLKIVQANKEPA